MTNTLENIDPTDLFAVDETDRELDDYISKFEGYRQIWGDIAVRVLQCASCQPTQTVLRVPSVPRPVVDLGYPALVDEP